jgi:DNA topoisomerase II
VPICTDSADEILVNAADNFQRDNRMNLIKIDINRDDNTISIWNNGKGIPIEIHKEQNCYVPEMIFGKSTHS